MAKNFRLVTNELFEKTGAEELAAQIGCSVQSVKQARMDVASPSHRVTSWMGSGRYQTDRCQNCPACPAKD
jgi:hypothetical protein